MKNLIITIFESEQEEGFYYDIYDDNDTDAIATGEANLIDGGHCTTTIENALDMATEQVKVLLAQANNK
jgi:hypothetical protein